MASYGGATGRRRYCRAALPFMDLPAWLPPLPSTNAVDWLLAATLLLGSIPGVSVGTWMAPRAPVRILRASLASLLLITGLSLI